MLLRRVTEHVKTQNWFAVAIDLLIVVIGVYIGIQVSNWNEARIEAKRGEEFAVRLRADIQAELRIFDREIEYYESVYDYALRTVELADRNDPALANEFIVSAYNATQYAYTEPVQATFDELVATGNLYLLEDQDLLSAGLFLYRVTVRLRMSDYVVESAYRQRVRRILPFDVQQAIREQCGDVFDEITGFTIGIRADCRIEYSEDRIAEAAKILRNDPDMQSDLRYLLSAFGYYISDLRAAKLQVERRLDGTYDDGRL